MKILVNERIGQHRYKTPEGYLICTDCVLSRTGKQEYKRSEVYGDSCDNSDELINVDRQDKDVFDEKAMTSFENKALTLEHPQVDVTADNYKDYSVGFVRDIHKGIVDGQNVMLGSLVITDANVVKQIENGEYTDLSCGYDCEIVDDENPKQINIRGNHVAICKEGRAGIAKISDKAIDKLNVGDTISLTDDTFLRTDEEQNKFIILGFYYKGNIVKLNPNSSVRDYAGVQIKNKKSGKVYTVNLFQIHDSIAVHDNDDYYGKAEAKKYGDMIRKKLAGARIDTSLRFANFPGGITYTAKKLGISDIEFHKALCGMLEEGHCKEVSNATLEILDSNNETIAAKTNVVIQLKNNKYLDEYGQETNNINRAKIFTSEKSATNFAYDVGYRINEYKLIMYTSMYTSNNDSIVWNINKIKSELRELGYVFVDLKNDDVYNKLLNKIESKYGNRAFANVYEILEKYINTHNAYDSFTEITHTDNYASNLQNKLNSDARNILSNLGLNKTLIQQHINYLGNLIETNDNTGTKTRVDRWRIKTKLNAQDMNNFLSELHKKYDAIYVNGNDLYITIKNNSYHDSAKTIRIIKMLNNIM